MTDSQKIFFESHEKNGKALLNILIELGIQHVGVNYTGCGGSGEVESIIMMPDMTLLQLDEFKIQFEHCEMKLIEQGSQSQWVIKEVSLKDALVSFVMNWVEHLYPVWKLDDGGFGDVEIDVEHREFMLEHNEYCIETFRHDSKY